MLRSDYRELRNSDLKLGWVVVGVEGKYRYSSQLSCYCTDAEQSLLKLSRSELVNLLTLYRCI